MKKITELYAFIGNEPDDDEGLVATNMFGPLMPLIASDDSRLTVLKSVAKSIADETGRSIKVVRFKIDKIVDLIQED